MKKTMFPASGALRRQRAARAGAHVAHEQLTGVVTVEHVVRKISQLLELAFEDAAINCQVHPVSSEESAVVMLGNGMCCTVHFQTLDNALTMEGGQS